MAVKEFQESNASNKLRTSSRTGPELIARMRPGYYAR